MWEPALRPDDIEAERTVILDEILMHADEPADLAARALAVGAVPGPPARARHARDGVVGAAHHPRRHRPPSSSATTARRNMVVSVAGDCRHEAVAGRPGAPFRRRRGRARCRARTAPGPDVVPLDVVRRPTEQAHLVYGARSVSRFDERRWALARAQPRAGRRPVEPAVPEGARAARPRLLGLVRAGGLRRTPARWPSWSGRRPSTSTRCCASSNGELELLAARRRHRARAGRGQGQPACRAAALGRGLGRPHEPDRRRRCCCTARCSRSTRSWRRIDAVDRDAGARRRRPAGRVAAHDERGGPLRRGGLRVPPARHGRPVACRPWSGSVWSAPAAAWAKRSAAPWPRRRTWSWWPRSTRRTWAPTPAASTIVGEVNALARPRRRGGGRLHRRRGGAPQRAALRAAGHPRRDRDERPVRGRPGRRRRVRSRGAAPTRSWRPTSPSARCC